MPEEQQQLEALSGRERSVSLLPKSRSREVGGILSFKDDGLKNA
jgi:hypothetical protein